MQYFINKYWIPNPNVFILGYDTPQNFKLAENFKLLSMGDDTGYDGVTKKLYDTFSKIDDSHFIFSVDDFIPIRPVNIDEIKYFEKQLLDSEISRLSLAGHLTLSPRYDVIDNYKKYKIIEARQNMDYRISTIWSMFTKDYFLKHLKDASDIWDWELNSRSKNDGHSVVGTNYPVIQTIHLFKRAKLRKNWWISDFGDINIFDDDKLVMDDFFSKWRKEKVIQLI
jgi:hypothetical protein